eukprot:snap_masked-scaffold_64-processed-gene-0.26-mRNA-1 protein AED:1.00 eAED:1.00 QI:0/0/0/0/1/1/2/0/117
MTKHKNKNKTWTKIGNCLGNTATNCVKPFICERKYEEVDYLRFPKFPNLTPPRSCTKEEQFFISYKKVLVKGMVGTVLVALIVWFFILFDQGSANGFIESTGTPDFRQFFSASYCDD